MRQEMAFSFALAIALVSAAIWIADRSLMKREAVPNSPPNPIPSAPAAPTITAGGIGASAEHGPEPRGQESAASTGISKCVVNGKTVYSDEACPRGAVGKPVEVHHAAGIVSPDRQTIEDTLERSRLQRWVDAVPGRSATRTTTRGGKVETQTFDNPLPMQASARPSNNKILCDSYAERVTYLDGLARQPQSAAAQDWIKEEKAKTQSAAFNAGC